MTAIVCVEDRNGMLFGGRRLSRDRILCDDVIRLCGQVSMLPYSAELFEAFPNRIQVTEQLLEDEGSIYFVETDSLKTAELDGLIIYRWNRRYPADLFLEFDPETHGMVLTDRTEFAGYSHERITRESWRKAHGETE